MVGNNKIGLSAKDITLIALMSSLVFAQEQLLVFLPNVQLTAFLLILFSKKFGFIRTTIIIFIYVILDNIVFGTFNLVFTPFMFIGWMLIPIIFCSIFRKTNSLVLLAFGSALCSFGYCWIYIIPNYILYNIDPLIYLSSDIIFELIFVVVNMGLILSIYKPCSKLIDKLVYKYSI